MALNKQPVAVFVLKLSDRCVKLCYPNVHPRTVLPGKPQNILSTCRRTSSRGLGGRVKRDVSMLCESDTLAWLLLQRRQHSQAFLLHLQPKVLKTSALKTC